MATDIIARGLAAKTWATARANSIAVEEFGARPTGDSRAAVQRAIDLAVANGIPKVTSRLPRMELWEPVVGDLTTLAGFNASRTLTIPACDSFDLDGGGARITLKGPGGVARNGQVNATAAASGASFDGKWKAGFITVTGVIANLRIANIDVEGGFTGDTANQDNFNLYDKGFLYQDKGDANLGPGNGAGIVSMDNVVLHGFGGEIMYDNSSRSHISRDCHFYNSGHSCWNPSGQGRVVAHNLQAGIARQTAEILGGKGHTYIGGRFYKNGGGGATFIGGPDPAFGATYADPVRRTDAAPPYVTFIGTRFEEFANYLYLGSYMRGSIICTDVPVFIAQGFASNGTIKDIDLDVYATVDRLGAFSGVQVAGPGTNDGTQPRNINVRVHCSRTALAVTNAASMTTGLAVSGIIDPSCTFSVDGIGSSPFSASFVAGSTLPMIDTTGFNQYGNPDYLYFSTDQTYTIASRIVNLYPTGAGTFNFVLNTARGYTQEQLFTFYHDGSGSADRIVSFAQNGAGMRLNATRTLRRAGEYLSLRRVNGYWVEHAYVGDEGPQTIPVLASAMIPNVTNGPAPGLTESGTNKVMLATLDFDASTGEAAQIAIPMPRSWNRGAVAVQFVWTAGTGTNASVVWGCQALALSDDDPLDAVFGTAQLVTDAVTAAGDVMETAFSAPITVAGSPATDDLVVFRLYRDAAHAADTLTADARLIAVRIRYNADAGNDA